VASLYVGLKQPATTRSATKRSTAMKGQFTR